MFSLEKIAELAFRLDSNGLAKASAFFFAPALVLSAATYSVSGHAFSIDLDRPVTIAELRTQLGADGRSTQQRGVAVIVEPSELEYRLRLGRGTRLWTSMDSSALRANATHVILDSTGLVTRAPFIGISEPVTFVLDGELGPEVDVLGGHESVEGWRGASRRSMSIVSSILIACVFAFGMSLPTVMPFLTPEQHAAREKRA